jgi:RNA polymerase sigma-70 factor (ECF subfamily)
MDESELIKKVFDEAGDDGDAIERARARLLDAIRVEEARQKRRRRRLVLPAAAAVTVAAIAAVVVAVIGPIGGSTAAATELRRLARIASSTEAPDVGPGEYFLTVSDELRPESFTDVVSGSAYTVISRLHLRTWIASDGSSFRVTEVISSRFASEADRRAWEEAGRPEVPEAGDRREETSRPGQAFWVDLSRLPRESAELLAALRSGEIVPRPPGDEQVFLLIGELLGQGDAPPELRAALLEAAAGLEDVEKVGQVTDPLGRTGQALAVDGASLRTQLVFDPATADLLSIELYGSDGGSVGAPMSWIAFRSATVVDSAPEFERPAGSA